MNAEPIYAVSLDWAQVMRDLANVGVSGYRVSQIMEIEWSTVQRWVKGGEPFHRYGQALLAVHARYCGESLTRQRQDEAKPKL
jgi:hypothetical protein